MRIALTITELHPGGAEKCFVNLACFLKQQGHDVRVWQLWPKPPSAKRILTDQLDQAKIQRISGNAVRAWDFPVTAHWLRRELRAFSPDVVQSFLFHANIATAYAVRGMKCPLFGGARVSQPQRTRAWLQRIASKRMQQLVCVSESVAQHSVQKEGIPAERVCVIPNGLDLSSLSMAPRSWTELGLPETARVILYVGRLDEQKGVTELLRYASRFLIELPEHHVVLMGDGPLRDKLAFLHRQHAFADRIHFAGWQTAPETWMQIAEMLVLPARYEGMPNVVLEAMAVGKPVVAFEVDGIRELLGNSSQSELQILPPQDFDSLASSIISFSNAPELARKCGEENRQTIEARFQLEKQLLRYQELYQQAVKGQSR